MCFSAGASFAGGVIITGIGVGTLREVHKPSQLLFASIPLFFGVQQIIEGCLWMSLPHTDYFNIQRIATYCFMVMAQVLWPTLIPVSVLFMEKNKKRIRILQILSGMGLALSLYYAVCLLSFHVTPKIMGYHIEYKTDFPDSFAIAAFIVYLVATITPLFCVGSKKNSSVRYINVFFLFYNCNVFYSLPDFCMVFLCGIDKCGYLLDTH